MPSKTPTGPRDVRRRDANDSRLSREQTQTSQNPRRGGLYVCSAEGVTRRGSDSAGVVSRRRSGGNPTVVGNVVPVSGGCRSRRTRAVVGLSEQVQVWRADRASPAAPAGGDAHDFHRRTEHRAGAAGRPRPPTSRSNPRPWPRNSDGPPASATMASKRGASQARRACGDPFADPGAGAGRSGAGRRR